LPTGLERRFYLAAGMLECVDREFVSIAKEIDEYQSSVVEELKRGDLDIEINTASLKEYLSDKFDKLIKEGLLRTEFGERAKLIVDEVQLFGISKLYQLDNIIPEDLQDKMLSLQEWTNFAGLIRDILIINDAKKYFEVCWRNNWRFSISEGEDSFALYKEYGIDVKYLQEYAD
jgi:putative GTP pyrophosphokinase